MWYFFFSHFFLLSKNNYLQTEIKKQIGLILFKRLGQKNQFKL
ncbi:hypothetical protein AWRIB429_0530 [Oenococcus oeni AWRIB429]|uniref:Uncharacterized protein n=1 Tax=Oenococcus oeni AWRIB429 TaxID=655225 RepID=D3L850_OENOE|nr:hypothetical protein AWRIB429_0530 [Oenococcus oeni AWRIB429]KZD13763.1 hypothetical protein AC229_0420 [Oenococcus oeni]